MKRIEEIASKFVAEDGILVADAIAEAIASSGDMAALKFDNEIKAIRDSVKSFKTNFCFIDHVVMPSISIYDAIRTSNVGVHDEDTAKLVTAAVNELISLNISILFEKSRILRPLISVILTTFVVPRVVRSIAKSKINS